MQSSMCQCTNNLTKLNIKIDNKCLSNEEGCAIFPFKIYEKFGIQYYLIVDADKETVQIFMLTNNQYKEISFDPNTPFDIKLDESCTISVILKNIWE